MKDNYFQYVNPVILVICNNSHHNTSFGELLIVRGGIFKFVMTI